MPSPLKICFAASEVAPFSKTGGLADVAGALPRQLHRHGHDVRVITPLHGLVDCREHGLAPVDFLQDIHVDVGRHALSFSVWSKKSDKATPEIYFVDCPQMFHRESVYTGEADEAPRFALLSRAVFECCQRMAWAPDVLHCHDWHTALIPLLRRTVYEWDQLFQATRTLVTIHNIGYQGVFPSSMLDELGLDGWSHMFDQEEMREGRVNFLRTGLIYADAITTVSPSYAREIQTPEYGMGLSDLLRARSDRLTGILNGVDYDEWSPERDRYIPHRYSRARPEAKAKNKAYLLQQMGLSSEGDAPLIGIVSRLTAQKGFDLCFEVLPEILAERELRLCVLGSGETKYEEFFDWLSGHFPGRVAYFRGYSEELAHLIEAGSDMFLMPSRFEPCGLNQMFSLRYGTIPIVRRTGGLGDSVELFDVDKGTGTGFVFDRFESGALRWAMEYALRSYAKPEQWRGLMQNAMARNYSWEKQVEDYLEIYRWLPEA
ncbi:MAG: glycogen synthase GlgA [bacterium]|nr:glycogen synthase GlgA [bacterium]